MRPTVLVLVAFASTSLTAGCDPPSLPDRARDDASLDAPACFPSQPRFAADQPTRIPYRIATLNGLAPGAAVVFVDGIVPNQPTRIVVGLDDAFCLDINTVQTPPDGGVYHLTLRAQSAEGLPSCSESNLALTIDPSAPPIAGAQTCGSINPAQCTTDHESGALCSNGLDDDCDGSKDALDPECASCRDDLFEPNDELANPPRVVPNTTEPLNLTLCPSDHDYFGLAVSAGNMIGARIDYPAGGPDVQLELYDPEQHRVAIGPVHRETDGHSSRLVTATYTPSDGGVSNPAYRVHVFTAGATAVNYTLRVNRF